MAKSIPKFFGKLAHYHPDTCLPLKTAMLQGNVELKAVVHGDYPGTKLPGLVLPEVRTAGYWNTTQEQNWGLDWHRNEGIEFTYLHRGTVDFAVENQKFKLQPGDLTITRPWQLHRVGDPYLGASRLTWLILDVRVRHANESWVWPPWIILSAKEVHRLTSLLRKNEHPVWKADSLIADAFKKIDRLADSTAAHFDRTGMILAVNELLFTVLALLEKRGCAMKAAVSSSELAVSDFLQALPQQVGEPWTVETMAEKSGIKRSQFTNLCRKLTNSSPLEFLLQTRVEAAERMLRDQPRRPILEIALDCGFSSSQHFSTAFRRISGKAPRDVRKG